MSRMGAVWHRDTFRWHPSALLLDDHVVDPCRVWIGEIGHGKSVGALQESAEGVECHRGQLLFRVVALGDYNADDLAARVEQRGAGKSRVLFQINLPVGSVFRRAGRAIYDVDRWSEDAVD